MSYQRHARSVKSRDFRPLVLVAVREGRCGTG
jgi:hypothetical protein